MVAEGPSVRQQVSGHDLAAILGAFFQECQRCRCGQDQEALDASVFYLLSSAHPASRNGLPIDGYSCLEYGGHMFWCARVSFAKPALCIAVGGCLIRVPIRACARVALSTR